MLNRFRKLLGLCIHEWKHIEKVQIYGYPTWVWSLGDRMGTQICITGPAKLEYDSRRKAYDEAMEKYRYIKSTEYRMRCKHCGRMKKYTF